MHFSGNVIYCFQIEQWGDYMSDLSERLRSARINAGLTQQSVAEMSGIGYKTINNYENAASKPDVEKLAILCRIYGVTADFFIDVGTSDSLQSKLETTLISNFRALNEDGQERLITYSDDLVHSGRYIKNNRTGLRDKA